MKSKPFFRAALLAATGALSSCFPGDDPSLGQFCASPSEGGEYCTSTKRGPSSAWAEAKAHGTLPIQMWAEWPEDVTREEVIRSRSKLDAWFADIDEVLFYLRVNAQSAESYRASMDGRLGDLLRQAKSRQRQILSEEPVDAIGNFKAALAEKANAEKDPLVAEIAIDKQAMSAARSVLDGAKEDASPLGAAYKNLVAEYSSYRATEAVETAAYEKLAGDASTTTLDTIDDVEKAILNAAKAASAKPNDLVLHALELSAEIQQFELTSEEAIAPHTEFMAAHAASMPDMTSGAERSINAMLGYVEQRVKRSDKTATSLVTGLVLRRHALALLGAGPDAGEDAMASRSAQASAAFQADTGALLAQLDEAGATENALGSPDAAKRRRTLKTLLQLKPLCTEGSSSFREAACKPLRQRFAAMAAELDTLESTEGL
ncbi:hypothetical protein [Polyangium jinanense]|uniref:Lipoprotein n=1 Tax=Polyangium jinanense TaxID=2829994 RepID=A0A9X3XBY4_9BACT|nr:hypothetical protein [Polyangium jinanense]MDC3960052.1 hypothetical protein [Polyangium jinanense]MDC3986188.1 hypothetical protein [Polyangium jinanense]